MILQIDPAPTPRQGVTLRALIVCRISGPNQDVRSLADQEARARGLIAAAWGGPVECKVIASRGSGEYLDRAELGEIERELESDRYDLLVTEDLGRIARRIRAYEICEIAEDHGTRVLAINDAVDTGRDGWRMGAFFSVVRHEMYNQDTAARIRRSLRNRFVQGGVIQFVPYGIVKPPGAKTDSELTKDPAAGPIYDRWFTLLEQGATYAEVAAWLNEQGVPTGPHARSGRWDGHLVRQTTFNPLLKGMRVRNEKMSKRINKSGKRRSVKAPPNERLERPVPHLAFIDPARYDRVIATLRERNAKYRRRGGDGRDARAGVPRKRTRWPGQHLTCGICRRPFYYGGHGRKDFMMCSGNRGHACWNGATAHGPRAAERIAAAIRAEIEALEGFDAAFEARLGVEVEALRAAQTGRLADLARREVANRRARENIVATLRQSGPQGTLVAELDSLDAERDRLLVERRGLEALPGGAIRLPSRARIREIAGETFADLAAGSPEFGRLMHRLVPRLEALPCRLLDGGAIVLRAHLTLDLAPLIPGAEALAGLSELLRRELVVDLFDPPQREAFRPRVTALRAEGRSEREAARELGLTVTAAQSAARLDRMMREAGLADAYVAVTEPPPDQTRMRKHRHPRYSFRPKGPDEPSTGPARPGPGIA
jgi:DNA invertase Pin-like site-specific DNA recombinase